MLNTLVEGAGYPLVWSHGLQGSIAYEEACGLFHGKSPALRRIRFDARGHGASPGSTEADAYRWPQLAADMLNIAMQYAQPGPFALGGQSMGCATALEAAMLAPERVSHLVLVIPPTAWSTRAAQVDRYQRAVTLLQRRGMTSFLQATRQFPALPAWLRAAHPHLEPARLEALGEFTAERLIPILQGASGSDLPSPESLHALQMPCLILAWTDDETHPLSTARQLADHLPNARLEIAEHSAAVDRWAEVIEQFVLGSA
jgi:3-oxoadipate enol-lactonase